MDFLPVIAWAVSAKVFLVHDAERDTYRTCFWNFLIMGLMIGGWTGDSDGAQ